MQGKSMTTDYTSSPFFFFFLSLSFKKKLYGGEGVCVCVCMRRSEDTLWESVPSYYHVGLGDRTQAIGLGSRHPQSHLASHLVILIIITECTRLCA